MTATTQIESAAVEQLGAEPGPRRRAHGPARSGWWRVGVPLLVAVLGTLASIAVYRLSLSWEGRAAEAEFQNQARSHLQVIDGELQAAATLLHTLRAFFDAHDGPVSRAEFLRFSKDLHGRVVGLRDTGWAPRVTLDQRAAFERAAAANGAPGFRIQERGEPGKLVTAGERAEYYPILYLDSGTIDRPVLGFDLASEPVRRGAIAQALASQGPAATPPIKLITVKRPRGGAMGFIPVYCAKAEAGGPSPVLGVALGVVDIDAMMDNIVAERARLAGIDVYIYDATGSPGERQVYWRSARGPGVTAPSEAAALAATHWQGTVSLLDQRWTFVFLPTSPLEGVARNRHPVTLLIVGLTMTAMVVAYLLLSLRRTLQLERLAAELRCKTEDLARNADKIAHMARHDTLTDLPNRALFRERMDEAVARLARGVPFALLCLDLDHFKAVNDSLGHGAGDRLLCQAALRMRACVRDVDTVARLGGDEFAVLLAGTASAVVAERVAAGLVAVVGADYDLGGHGVATIGLSIGIALAPADGGNAETLLAHADRALYGAKAAGRGRYGFFSRTQVLLRPGR